MPVATILRCPSCGAAASSDATKCGYCGARLATVACPSCFGMMFLGEKFCSHCGAIAQRIETSAPTTLLCPKCETALKGVQVGKSKVWECPACEGMWLDAPTMQQIYAEREAQAAVLGMPVDAPTPAHLETDFRYVACPVCRQLMNRLNFARCSGVVIDVCKEHGTWFDKDELRRIVEFIRAGGLDKAREREKADLKAEQARSANAANAAIPPGLQSAADAEWRGHSTTTGANMLSDLADLLGSFFK